MKEDAGIFSESAVGDAIVVGRLNELRTKSRQSWTVLEEARVQLGGLDNIGVRVVRLDGYVALPDGWTEPSKLNCDIEEQAGSKECAADVRL